MKVDSIILKRGNIVLQMTLIFLSLRTRMCHLSFVTISCVKDFKRISRVILLYVIVAPLFKLDVKHILTFIFITSK